MNTRVLLGLAGLLQLALVAANFVLPGRIGLRAELGRVSPIVRQMFHVHHVYIVGVLVLFAGLCFLFPGELAGGSRLGRFLCGFMALFWGVRVPIQLFYYDPELRRSNRLEDVLVTLLLATLGGCFSAVWLAGRLP